MRKRTYHFASQTYPNRAALLRSLSPRKRQRSSNSSSSSSYSSSSTYSSYSSSVSTNSLIPISRLSLLDLPYSSSNHFDHISFLTSSTPRSSVRNSSSFRSATSLDSSFDSVQWTNEPSRSRVTLPSDDATILNQQSAGNLENIESSPIYPILGSENESESEVENDAERNRTPVPSNSDMTSLSSHSTTQNLSRASSSIVSSFIEHSTAFLGSLIRATLHLPFQAMQGASNTNSTESSPDAVESLGDTDKSLGEVEATNVGCDDLDSMVSSSSRDEGENEVNMPVPSVSTVLRGNALILRAEPSIQSYQRSRICVLPEMEPYSGNNHSPVGIDCNYNDHPPIVFITDDDVEDVVEEEEASVVATNFEDRFDQIYNHDEDEVDSSFTLTTDEDHSEMDEFDRYHFSSFGFHNGEQYTSEEDPEAEDEHNEEHDYVDHDQDDEEGDEGYELLYPNTSAWSPTSHDFYPPLHFSEATFSRPFLAEDIAFSDNMGARNYMGSHRYDRVFRHLVLSGGVLSRPTSMFGISSQLGNYIPDHELDQMSYEDFLELGERIGYVKTSKRKRVEVASSAFESLEHWDGLEAKCTICLTDYLPKDIVSQLPLCSHVFHTECLNPWINEHSTCPICRTEAA